jgi:sugar phosphate permease
VAPQSALLAAAALNAVVVLTMAAVLVLPVMAPAVAADTGLPTSLLGAYSFLMWTAALAASSGVGKLIGRFGAVRLAQTSLALCAVGVACGATGLTAALVAMPALIGIACALETPASSDILARVTPPASRTFVFSLKQTGVQTGGMLAGVLFPAALPVLGWRGAMAALAVLLLAGAVALEPMHRRLEARAPTVRPPGGGPTGFSYILRTRTLRDLATASFVFHAMQVCLNTFLVAYLVGEHDYSLAAAGLLLTIAQFGGFVGRLGFGFLLGPRLAVIRLLAGIGLGMTAAALGVGLAAGDLPKSGLALLCFAFGLTASGWNGVFLAEVARQAPPGEIARVTGGAMVSAYAGLILGPVAFSAAAASAATLGAGYLLLAGATLAGTIVLHRHRHDPPPRAV